MKWEQARRRPLVLKCKQWWPKEEEFESNVPDELGVVQGEVIEGIFSPGCGTCGWIETLEGGHIVTAGDWIMIGVNGERWPVKPDIFEKTYELLTQEGHQP